MARIVSVSGVGAMGSAAVLSQTGDADAVIEIRFAADPWQTQPTIKGTVTLAFDGEGPKRAVALDGWATLDPHLGNPATIQWTAPLAPLSGDRQRIAIFSK